MRGRNNPILLHLRIRLWLIWESFAALGADESPEVVDDSLGFLATAVGGDFVD